MRWRNFLIAVVFLGLFFGLFAFGDPFLHSRFPWMSLGLIFCLLAALSSALFLLVAPAFAWTLARSDAPKVDEVPESPPTPIGWLRSAGLIAAFIVFGVCWYVMAYIETNALSQPDHAIGIYSVRENLKGVVRYLTPGQALLDRAAFWMSLLGIGVIAIPALGTRLIWRFRANRGTRRQHDLRDR
jgi:hypothetical protein